jgi:hypothetical protein
MNQLWKAQVDISNQVVFKKVQGNYLRVIIAEDTVPMIETGISFQPIVIKAPSPSIEIFIEFN